jgi:hypothetical protein
MESTSSINNSNQIDNANQPLNPNQNVINPDQNSNSVQFDLFESPATFIGHTLFTMAFASSITYLGVRAFVWLAKKIGFNPAINPAPFVVGVTSTVAFKNLILGVEWAALKIIGNREEWEGKEAAQTTSKLDGFRVRFWGMAKYYDSTVEKADKIYSRLFKVRTDNQIKASQISEENLTMGERFRHVFKEAVRDFIVETLPFALSVLVVTTIFGGPALTVATVASGAFISLIFFFNTLLVKEDALRKKIEEAKKAQDNPNTKGTVEEIKQQNQTLNALKPVVSQEAVNPFILSDNLIPAFNV